MPATRDLDMLKVLWSAPTKMRSDVLANLLQLKPELASPVAQDILKRHSQMEETLQQSQHSIEELQTLVDEVTRPPLIVAGVVAVSDGRCVVALGHARREVAIHPTMRG